MNKKNGFIMSTYVYMLLVFFLLLLGSMLVVLNNTKLLSNRIKVQGERLNAAYGYNFEIIGGEETYTFIGEEYNDEGFRITTEDGTDLSKYVKTTSNVNINKIGAYTVKYRVTYSKRVNTFTRNVYVIDKTMHLSYKDRAQKYTAPMDGYYKVELWGAQGGNYDAQKGGKGSYTSGYIYLTKGEELYAYVGEQPVVASSANYSAGGYNGGGNSGYNSTSNYSRGGGGATDIRYFGNVNLSSADLEWNSTLGLNSRIMVAAGGGGSVVSGDYKLDGAAGGELLGNPGVSTYSSTVPQGGTQITYGTGKHTEADRIAGFGFGGGMQTVGTNTGWGGGGGSGYYGGALGHGFPGGSGSSFISGYAGVNAITSSTDRTHTNTTMHYSNKYFIDGKIESGINEGDGKAIITFVSKNKPERLNTKLNNVRYIEDCINGNTVNTTNAWNELQAIVNGVNVAKGKTVTTTGTLSTASGHSYSLESLVNGNIAEPNYDNLALNETGLQCVTVDLGQTYDLDEVAVWHMWEKLDNRLFNENTISVSSNNSNWTTISNSLEEERNLGKRISAYNYEFEYTGDYQTFTAPKKGYYKIELWGASGGYSGGSGGRGGYTLGYIYLNKNENIYTYVGGAGTSEFSDNVAGSGYNGGGNGSKAQATGDAYKNGAGGGGSTDVRLISGTWNNEASLNSRIMVAAGGGGGAYISGNYNGGNGGGLFGSAGTGRSVNPAAGTPTSGNAFAIGQDGIYATGSWGESGRGGGGAGYYGGNASQTAANGIAGGGGGSSFISGYAGVNAITSSTDRTHTNNTKHYSNKYFLNGEMKQGVHEGNGKAKISFIGETLERVNTSLDNVRYVKDCINGSTANTANHWVEIQAIKDGSNLALGKTVTGTVAQSNATTAAYSNIVDGRIENITGSSGFGQSASTGLQCVTIDLEAKYDLDEIGVWHYYVDGRKYYYNVTYTSSDNITWLEAINSYEVETSLGKRVSAYK